MTEPVGADSRSGGGGSDRLASRAPLPEKRGGVTAFLPISYPTRPSNGSGGRTGPSASGSRELDPSEEGPKAERIVEPERLSVAQIVAVDRRLERARDQEQSGVERMEGGRWSFMPRRARR